MESLKCLSGAPHCDRRDEINDGYLRVELWRTFGRLIREEWERDMKLEEAQRAGLILEPDLELETRIDDLKMRLALIISK